MIRAIRQLFCRHSWVMAREQYHNTRTRYFCTYCNKNKLVELGEDIEECGCNLAMTLVVLANLAIIVGVSILIYSYL